MALKLSKKICFLYLLAKDEKKKSSRQFLNVDKKRSQQCLTTRRFIREKEIAITQSTLLQFIASSHQIQHQFLSPLTQYFIIVNFPFFYHLT
jgi:hypothetical protein